MEIEKKVSENEEGRLEESSSDTESLEEFPERLNRPVQNIEEEIHYEHLQKDKEEFLEEISKTLPVASDPSQKLNLLVEKADLLANYLLTKHRHHE